MSDQQNVIIAFMFEGFNERQESLPNIQKTFATIGFVVVEEIFIILNHGNDDAAGGVFMGVLITFISIVFAAAAAMFERILQNAVDIKSENDLTV